jgi:hypothetical protein
MKTLYALALICLSVPAFAGELDFDGPPSAYKTETGYLYDAGADFNFGGDNTVNISVPATPKSDDHSVAAIETGYLYDAGADFNFGDENTATIIVPPAPKSEDYPLELGLVWDDDSAYQQDMVDLDAIPADGWF